MEPISCSPVTVTHRLGQFYRSKNNYVSFQAVVSTLRDADETGTTAVSDLSLSRDVARLSEVADFSEGPEDDDNGEHCFFIQYELDFEFINMQMTDYLVILISSSVLFNYNFRQWNNYFS